MVVAGKRGIIGSYSQRSHVLCPSKLRSSIAGAKVKHVRRSWPHPGTPSTLVRDEDRFRPIVR